MKVELTLALEEFIQEVIAKGQHKTLDEVVCHSLKLMAEKDKIQNQPTESLRRELKEGIEQIKN